MLSRVAVDEGMERVEGVPSGGMGLNMDVWDAISASHGDEPPSAHASSA